MISQESEEPLETQEKEAIPSVDVYEKIIKTNGKTILNLMGCDLKHFPSEIAEIKNLDCLFLTNNAISHIPDEIKQLENLEALTIQGNCLTELNPALGK